MKIQVVKIMLLEDCKIHWPHGLANWRMQPAWLQDYWSMGQCLLAALLTTKLTPDFWYTRVSALAVVCRHFVDRAACRGSLQRSDWRVTDLQSVRRVHHWIYDCKLCTHDELYAGPSGTWNQVVGQCIKNNIMSSGFWFLLCIVDSCNFLFPGCWCHPPTMLFITSNYCHGNVLPQFCSDLLTLFCGPTV